MAHVRFDLAIVISSHVFDLISLLHMKINNLTIWAFLVVFTSSNYFLSQKFAEKSLLIALIIFTLVKVFLVVWQFMEMKKAHPAWLMMITLILIIFAGAILALKI